MSDLFWNIATSDIALWIVGIILLAAFVVAKVPLIKSIPAVAPYVLLAGLVYHLALADLALCIGFRIADERAEKAQLKIDLAFRENELAQQKATAEDADRIAKEKANEAEELKGRVADYEAQLAKQPAGACALDDTDLDGLRFDRRTKKR